MFSLWEGIQMKETKRNFLVAEKGILKENKKAFHFQSQGVALKDFFQERK